MTARQRWAQVSALGAAAAAAALPLSTSVASGALVVFALAALGAVDRTRLGLVYHPAMVVTLALVGFAGASLAWTSASWPEALRQLGSYGKLAAVPLLALVLDRPGALRVAFAFLASNVAILILSTTSVLWPEGPWGFMKSVGVPFNDYASQSLQFTLCAFGLAHGARLAFLGRRWGLAFAALALLLAFGASVALVAAARTSFFVMAVLAALFVWQTVPRPRLALAGALGAVALVGAGVLGSDYARTRIAAISTELEQERSECVLSSSGLRTIYWTRGIAFVAEAPLFGHGVGATRELATQQALREGRSLDTVAADAHQQILHVAIHLGALGIVLLLGHFALLAGLFWDRSVAAWIGLGVVAQFFVSSLVNSHLTVFTLGWIYVLGIGACASIVLRDRLDQRLDVGKASGLPLGPRKG